MKLNPQIRTIEIGIRELREVMVYPMSLADQLKLSDLITDSLAKLQSVSELNSSVGLISFILNLIKEKSSFVLKMVLDENEDPDEFMGNISNEQFVEFVKLIIEVNFDPISKNLKGLLKKAETAV
jgi:hypothetical protein